MAGHEAVLDGRDELGVLGLVLGSDLGEGDNGSGLGDEKLDWSPIAKETRTVHTFLWTTVPRRALPFTMA